MTILLILLAIPGVLAVLLRLGIALLHTGKHTVEWYVAKQISDQRASHGDLSGLAEAEKVRAEYVSVLETLNLHYVERYMKWTETSYRHYRRLLFPLRGDDGRSVDGLLCCQHYD